MKEVEKLKPCLDCERHVESTKELKEMYQKQIDSLMQELQVKKNMYTIEIDKKNVEIQ